MEHGTDEQALLPLLEQALELRDRGQAIDVEALCADRPDLAPALRSALGLAGNLKDLQFEAAQHDRHLGAVLGERYRLDQRIGAGSMGVVYRAFDRELQRRVAVKVLAPDSLADDEAQARFQREGEVLAAVNHPAVVTVHDRGATPGGDHWLVMELLEGRNGSQWIEAARDAAAIAGIATLDDPDWLRREGRLDGLPEPGWLRSVVHWIATLADGLAAAHHQGVRHRDVKPSNVFVRRDGRPVLLDFGIAARTAEATLAGREKLVGTPAFLAPELLQAGKAGGSIAADVYGLGATLYGFLTLQPPYAGTLPQVIALMARREPRPAHKLRPMPRDLTAVLERAIERDPARRYPSATAFAADLRAFLAHRPVGARPISPLVRALRVAARSPYARTAAAVVGLGALVAGGLAWREHAATVRRAAADRAWAELPPTLSMSSNFAQRRLAPAAHERWEATLTTVVDGAADPLPALLQRSALRLDHDDRRGCAADLAAVAALAGTPYTAAVAAWAASESATAAAPVPPAQSAAAPTAPADHQVAAFLTMRGERSAATLRTAIDGLLAVPATASRLELLGVLLLELQAFSDPAERLDLCRQAYDAGLRAAQAFGGPTATTAFLMASGLTGQRRDAEALPFYREVLALCPDHFGSRMNLGIALRQLGRAAEAITELQAAVAQRPDVLKAHESLVRALLDGDDFGAAQRQVAQAPWPDSPAGAARRAYFLGQIELTRAVRALARDDHPTVVAAAALAVGHYAAAGDVPNASAEGDLAAALASDDRPAAATSLLAWLARQPTSVRRLEDVTALLPDTLDQRQTQLLRAWLQALIQHLAPPEAGTDPTNEFAPNPTAPQKLAK